MDVGVFLPIPFIHKIHIINKYKIHIINIYKIHIINIYKIHIINIYKIHIINIIYINRREWCLLSWLEHWSYFILELVSFMIMH